MLQVFIKKVLGQANNDKLGIRDLFFKRNNKYIIPAASIVLVVSIYWTVIDAFSNNYNLEFYSKIGVIAQFITSAIMLVLFSRKKEYSNTLSRILYMVFYLVVIAGVSILIFDRNKRIVVSGVINNDIGVSISAFYLFIMAFMPMPDVTDSIILLIMMVGGLVCPDLVVRTSTYSLFSHIVLAMCFVASYTYYRNSLMDSITFELDNQELNDQMKERSYCDGLTGVLNRRAYDTYIESLILKKDNHKAGFICFDIDYFKRFNDYYGHYKGDEIIIEVAKTVENYLKRYDDCFLFRYAGDQFIAVIDNVFENNFKNIMMDINQIVYQKNILRDDIKDFSRITITVGGAIEDIPNLTGDYVSNADNQLYLGKQNKRNCAYYLSKSLFDDSTIVTDSLNINNNYLMSKILNSLCVGIDDIYSVDCATKLVSVHRHGGKVIGIDKVVSEKYEYDPAFRLYIENNVHPLDKEMFYKRIEFNNLYNSIKLYGVVNFYYRVLRNDKLSYYKMKAIPHEGTKEDFKAIACAFLPEEIDVNSEQIASILETDELTGVYTKQAFHHHARQYMDSHPNSHFTMVVSDIENFRLLNRIYGEVEANNALKYLSVKYSEIGSCKVLGRYAADEFAILLENNEASSISDYEVYANEIKSNSPIPYLTIKYGVYSNFSLNEPIGSICDKAILALKSVKHLNDNVIALYNDDIVATQYRKQMFETNFERGIKNNEFVIYCQPKYNAKTAQICGGEALVRWKNAEGEFVSPGDFIPIFEKSGTISKLDEYVFHFVCRKQKELLDAGYKIYPISVNVSRNTLFQANMLEKYKNIIESYDLDKKYVPIEITESWAIESSSIKEVVESVKNASFTLHMDDFGTGYSSLSSLNALPIDAVKLDKSLIDDIGNKNGDEILHHIIDLAHFLNLEVVAEGVENLQQYSFLKNMGCDTIQGFYFSKSIEFDKYIELIK